MPTGLKTDRLNLAKAEIEALLRKLETNSLSRDEYDRWDLLIKKMEDLLKAREAGREKIAPGS